MNQRIDAVFESGIFRPAAVVNLAEGQCVSLNVETEPAASDDLNDVRDLLDSEFMALCRAEAGHSPSLAEVRQMLSVFPGSLAERISEERDEG